MICQKLEKVRRKLEKQIMVRVPVNYYEKLRKMSSPGRETVAGCLRFILSEFFKTKSK